MLKRTALGDIEIRNMTLRIYGTKSERPWGDDWDDSPYEHNAGSIYQEYVSKYADVVFPFGTYPLEPKDDWRCHGNSMYSKEDMLRRRVPALVIVKNDEYSEYYNSFTKALSEDSFPRIYLMDNFNSVVKTLKEAGAKILRTVDVEDEIDKDIYIIGPISGYERNNIDAFRKASIDLRKRGYRPHIPHTETYPTMPWDEAMRKSIRKMLEIGYVAALPGWEQSKGASIEMDLCKKLGIDVMLL